MVNMQQLRVKARVAALGLADVMRPGAESETNSDWPQQLSHETDSLLHEQPPLLDGLIV